MNTMEVVASCGHKVRIDNARKYRKERIEKHQSRPCRACRTQEMEMVGSCGHTFTFSALHGVSKDGLCPSCRKERRRRDWEQKAISEGRFVGGFETASL
jgi:hypothetical protein